MSCKLQHRYVNSPALSGCHLHFKTLTRMKISASFHPHYRCFTHITDISPTFCNCQVKKYPPPQKIYEKTETKLYLQRKRRLENPLVSIRPWTFNNTMYDVSLWRQTHAHLFWHSIVVVASCKRKCSMM